MRENLKTTKYANGTSIAQGSTYTNQEAYWYYPDNNSYNKETYGLLYNFPAIMHGASSSNSNPSNVQGICPLGWHVPSDAEWTQLIDHVGSLQKYRCGNDNLNIAKALSSSTGWKIATGTCFVGNEQSANNATNFSALPAGYGGFDNFGRCASFGSCTIYNYHTAFISREIYSGSAEVSFGIAEPNVSKSVRCLKDDEHINDGQPCPGTSTVTDVDGNIYNTIQIGDQCWMRENLRTTKYADNTYIELGSSTSTFTAYRYCPDNNSSNVSTYGYLYNWLAVMGSASASSTNPSGVQGICPTGWHVPSQAEWTQLTNYVGNQSKYHCNSSNTEMAKALADTTGWIKDNVVDECAPGYNQSTNNTTGFSIRPAGCNNGNYTNFGYTSRFWSTSIHPVYDNNRTAFWISYYYGYVDPKCGDYVHDGLSVRCLKD